MNLSLKSKLTVSYVALAAFLAISLLFVSKYFLGKQFQAYVAHKQDMRNEEILERVSWIFSGGNSMDNKTRASFLDDFGGNLYAEGIFMIVFDANGRMIYCADVDENKSCPHILDFTGISDDEICHDFQGTYLRRRYEIRKSGIVAGYISLGYHGPLNYHESDRVFLDGFNRIFFVITLVFLAASISVGLFMAARIASPIKRVTERTKRIADGEYSERVNILTGTTEIDDLSTGVDHLAENLQTQFKLKKRMAQAYSHEFRTPLAALQSNLEAMIDGIWAPSTARLEGLLSEIFRLSRMISEIENLVSAQIRDRYDSEKTLVDISDIAESTMLSFEPEIKQKEITLIHGKSQCETRVSPDRFKQVVVNLLTNAIKYTDKGGSIRINTFKRDDGRAIFMIEDSGIGISQADLPYIFEYLYRTDESRARDSGGNGIGLSVVKEIVESSGGTIEVESTPGRGSIFTVILPAT
jgi:signal transduction histidine kinase